MQGEPDIDVPGDPINPADIEAAAQVQEDEEEGQMENENMFEGDINNIDPSVGKNAIRDSWLRWDNGNIPYIISRSFDSRQRSIIAKAMEEFHQKTCIRFVPRTSERGYVHIRPTGRGCLSSVGRTGSRQELSLDPGCFRLGTVIHEFMHALGFYHEQSRTDRDKYVTILYKNIKPDMFDQFESYGQDRIDHLGAEYDTCSVMHYSPTAFSKVKT